MSHTFDAPLKVLAEQYPADWVAQLGLSTGARVDVIDTDLSAVAQQSDKVIRVHGADMWLLHLEFQTSRDPWLPRRALRYNVLLHDKHALPVLSVLILLRPEADLPHFTGTYEYQGAGQRGKTIFHYEVVRVWQQPVERFLAGGLGTLPLAPVSAVRKEELPQVIHQMQARLQTVEPEFDRSQLWFSTKLLMGLKYEDDFIGQLLQGVQGMEESTVYQSLKARFLAEGEIKGKQEGKQEGRLENAHNLLLLQGEARWGRPNTRIKRRIEAINDPEVLKSLSLRVLTATSWSDLLSELSS
jgi:predicted transposase YdaD